MNPSTHTPVLDLHALSHAHPGQPALADRWTAAIDAGVTLLHGDTGSGKSTLLQLIAGALPATSGQLTLRGVRLDADREAYRRQVFLFDPATAALDALTARACTAALSAGDTGFDEAEWLALIDAFTLGPHLDKPMYMLSTGSKRKVGLAAALASGRALVLLDEPTGGLDAGSVAALWRALARAAQRPQRAIVVASTERIDRVPLAGTIELPLTR